MFCAICTDECSGDRKAPIGRDDAMVVVCSDCDTLPPREKYGPERAYESTGGLLSAAESTAGMRRARGSADARLTKLDHQAFVNLPEAVTKAEADIAAVTHEGFRRRRTGAFRHGVRKVSR